MAVADQTEKTNGISSKVIVGLVVVLLVIIVLAVYLFMVPVGSSTKHGPSTAGAASTSQPPQKASGSKRYSSGTYKISSQMPAGEYRLMADNPTGYFVVSTDSSASRNSIITNGNFTTNTILTVQNGQYLTLTGATAYPLGAAPAVDTGMEGMFKIGADLPPGTYTVTPNTQKQGYIEVWADSSHKQASLVFNKIVSGRQQVTVSAGQYLSLTDAHIIQ